MTPFLDTLALAVLALAQGDAPAGTAQGEPVPEDAAFVETTAARATWYVGEVVPLRVAFGFDAAFLEQRLVRLFQRELDVPAQLLVPWFDGVSGAELVGPPRAPESARRATIALGAGVVEAARREDAGGRLVLELERDLRPTRPGELVLPGAALHFAWATSFRDDLLAGRTPLDRREATVRGQPLALEVLPLPERGRPPGFTGAVGRFDVDAEVDAGEVELGRGLRLVLRVRGEGDLSSLAPPRLELPGFRVRGSLALDPQGPGERAFEYDVAPLDLAVREVPAIPFAHFDPTPPAGYRTAFTEPLPVRVVPAGAAPRREPTVSAAPPAPPEEDDVPRRMALVAGLTIGALGISLVVLALRARRAEARPPDERAADAFRSLSEGDDPAPKLVEYLAARLGVREAAVVAPDLPRRLAAAGVPDELARRAGALVEDLMAARFGGPAAPHGTREIAALVDELESAFRANA